MKKIEVLRKKDENNIVIVGPTADWKDNPCVKWPSALVEKVVRHGQ